MIQELETYFSQVLKGKKTIKAILFYINDSYKEKPIFVSETKKSGNRKDVFESFDDGVKLIDESKKFDIKETIKSVIDSVVKDNPKTKLPSIYFNAYHNSEDFEIIYDSNLSLNKKQQEFLNKFSPEWQTYLIENKVLKEKDLDKIVRIDIWQDSPIKTITECIHFNKLVSVEIAKNDIIDLKNLVELKQVESVSLIHIKSNDWELPKSSNFKTLWLRNVTLNEHVVKKVLATKDNLIELGLTGCDLKQFPDWIFEFTNLKYLNLAFNHIIDWPLNFSKLKNLKTIWIGRNDTNYELTSIKIKEHWPGIKILNSKSDQP